MNTNQPSNDRHLGAIFFRRVEELGDRAFVKLQRGERFEEISWREFGVKVYGVILGLYALGLMKGDGVGIIAENCLEWLCADMATLAGGFPNVVISPSLSDMMVLKILAHSRCRAAFARPATRPCTTKIGADCRGRSFFGSSTLASSRWPSITPARR